MPVVSLEKGRVSYFCPGCLVRHAVNVRTDTRPGWEYNGDPESPTLSPAVLIRGGSTYQDKRGSRICHHTVSDGFITFEPHCTHDKAGMTLEMQDG